MKPIFKHRYIIQSQPFISALILTAILYLGGSISVLNNAIAAPQTWEVTPSLGKNQSDPTKELPAAVIKAVRQDLSRQINVPSEKLKIVKYSQETWADGCLGLAKPDEFCTQALVGGWRVVVSNGEKNWIYRTDLNGKVVRLEHDKMAINLFSSLAYTVSLENSANLQSDEIFRVTNSGGFAGRTYQTTLYKDGRVIQVLVNRNPTSTQPQIHKISPQQVEEFQQLLKQQQFDQFNQQNYPAPRGAADYITVTLTSPNATISYSDINQQLLPPALQQVIQAWNEIIQP